MSKKTLIAVVAVVVAIAFMLGLYLGLRPATQEGSKGITVYVIHKDGSEKTFTYRTDAEYLDDVLVEKGLITGYEGQYGLTIEMVDGETADWQKDSAYWAIYIGEEYASTGISEIVVTDGGVYKLVYEKL